MHIVVKRLTKWLVRAISVFLSEEKSHQLERWRRGREGSDFSVILVKQQPSLPGDHISIA